MLYPKNEQPLQDELFQNPTSEYRGTPFWAWNCQMTEEKVSMIVYSLEEMGMGGGHIHCRTGMNNPYMGEEFLHLVKDANEKFKKKEMITWLYDEDRWPSGAGGGLVTKDEQYRIRFLVFSPEPLEDVNFENKLSSSGQAVRSSKRKRLGRYQVCLEDGWLKDYAKIEEEETLKEGYDEWFAYIEISGDNPWFNNQSYVNTLDKKAIERFIEVTHEVYDKALGDEFGKSIPAIFTDEPQFCHKTSLKYASDKMQVIIPFTDDFEETFQAAYGNSLLDALPELFWEKGEDSCSVIRYQYHDHICERFSDAFADTIGNWCKEHNLMLTGHMMEEPTLKSQTAALGEAMRSYRSFQLPGIDMLCDWRELSTAKQAQSASRQFGCPGVLSELYGVTNWDFDFRGHKLQGDWQAALGVTVRVHHLTWTSMAGEAKRDYPAAIGYQSPWYKEYKYVEDYFSRINTLLTRGKADVKIGVIHPIESYWLYWGSEEKTGSIREEMDVNFTHLINWLLYGFQDFDFISESLLPIQNSADEIYADGFPVGEMKYQVILVPNCITLRESTLQRLKKFKEAGGRVLFGGNTPKYLDAKPSDEVKDFVKSCEQVAFTSGSLLESLSEYRQIEVRNEEGLSAKNMIYQMREDEEGKILFLAHVNHMANKDLPKKEELTIRIDGAYQVVCYEPLDGTKKELAVEWKHGKTICKCELYDHDSLLLRLYSAKELGEVKKEEITEASIEVKIPSRVAVTLSEPNVLLLDQAEYSFDHREWKEREEILRIDNEFREILGYPLRMEALAQPWVNPEEEEIVHCLSLRFPIYSDVEVEEVTLALESEHANVWLNGEACKEPIDGWYTDKEILSRRIGKIQVGNNELVVEIPYGSKVNIEAMFLLGDFGVIVEGSESRMTVPVRELSFGDITRQGLPFYGGNVQYQVPVQISERGKVKVAATRFRNPLLGVSLDGGEEKPLAFSPYCVDVPVEAGTHMIHITAYGNRVNTFGAVHNCSDTEWWYGPNAWRTTGDDWSYEYYLKKTGLLKRPVVTFTKTK